MTEDPTPKSRAMIWAGILFLLLLLYFSSVPWVVSYIAWHRSLDGAWVRCYAAPYNNIRDQGPRAVHDSIDRYDLWCWEKMGFAIPSRPRRTSPP